MGHDPFDGNEQVICFGGCPTNVSSSSHAPSVIPSLSYSPTLTPSSSKNPSNVPSKKSTDGPSDLPSKKQSDTPSNLPSANPSNKPSANPSNKPSNVPSNKQSISPSEPPSDGPSTVPSFVPSADPPAIENVALKKPSSQSSSAKWGNSSSKAVDGKSGNLSRTKWEQNPHWEVSLQADYKIKTIKLHLNAKKLGRAKKLRLEILNEGVRVWIHKLAGTPATSTIVLGVPESTSVGDKVKIFLWGTHRQLELREIEVMAAVA